MPDTLNFTEMVRDIDAYFGLDDSSERSRVDRLDSGQQLDGVDPDSRTGRGRGLSHADELLGAGVGAVNDENGGIIKMRKRGLESGGGEDEVDGRGEEREVGGNREDKEGDSEGEAGMIYSSESLGMFDVVKWDDVLFPPSGVRAHIFVREFALAVLN